MRRFRATRSEADFRTLYQRHTPMLYRVAVRMTQGNTSLAEEVVQETWARAVQQFERFEQRATLRTWLTGITLNCTRELHRETVRNETVELLPSSIPAPIETRIDTRDLERAIAELPLGYRQVIVLHDIEGHTHADIANMLGVAPGTSKSQLARARAALRTKLVPASQTQCSPNAEESRP